MEKMNNKNNLLSTFQFKSNFYANIIIYKSLIFNVQLYNLSILALKYIARGFILKIIISKTIIESHKNIVKK